MNKTSHASKFEEYTYIIRVIKFLLIRDSGFRWRKYSKCSNNLNTKTLMEIKFASLAKLVNSLKDFFYSSLVEISFTIQTIRTFTDVPEYEKTKTCHHGFQPNVTN